MNHCIYCQACNQWGFVFSMIFFLIMIGLSFAIGLMSGKIIEIIRRVKNGKEEK